MTKEQIREYLEREEEIIAKIKNIRQEIAYYKNLERTTVKDCVVIICVLFIIFIAGFLWRSEGIIEFLLGWAIMIITGAITLNILLSTIPKAIKEHKIKEDIKMQFDCDPLIGFDNEIARLREEREQIHDKINAVFPGSDYYLVTDVKRIKRYLGSRNFYEACERAHEDEIKLLDYEAKRMERKMREEKENEYRQAVLNEQRRTNENLENLQRQQEYANRLAREAEYQRNYEDLKEKVNRKWGE